MRLKQLFVIISLLAGLSLLVGTQPDTQAASGDKFDLEIYPSVWTVTRSSSAHNMLAVRGKNGFTGAVTVTVSGLPSTMLDSYPTTAEISQGKGGYYCTSRCQAAPDADFPMALTIEDGQWTSVGPTILFGSATTTQTKTVTITATGGGESVSQSFTMKVIDDQFLPPEGGGPPQQTATANPDGFITINSAELGASSYKINLTAGQSRTVNVDVKNSGSGAVTLQLLSVLTSSGVTGLTSTISGGFETSSVTLAAGEQKTLPFTITTQPTSLNGTYEFSMGVDQADGSNRATLGISSIITGGASGATPTTTMATTTSAPTTSTTTSESSATQTTTAGQTTTSPSSSASVTPTETSSPTPSATDSETVSASTSSFSQPSASAISESSSPVASERSLLPTSEARVLAQTVTKDIFVPAAATGLAVAAASYATSVVPVAIMGGGVGVATMVTSYLLMLWNTLLEGIGLRRRRYPWGTVFEAGSDQPLELAIVRLKSTEGHLLETRVTDRMGRFGFLAQPGSYTVETMKNGYRLASALRAAGSRYQPLLTKENFIITKSDAVIRANIPLELLTKGRHLSGLATWLGLFHRPALVVTVPLSLWNYAALPTTLNLAILLILGLIIASQWLILTPRFFGTVSGDQHQGLAGIVLQLIRREDGKVLATQVTDRRGRYSFLALSGTYQIRVASPTWQEPSWLSSKLFRVTGLTGGLIAPWIRVRLAQPKDEQ
jgi:hypothetical protein